MSDKPLQDWVHGLPRIDCGCPARQPYASDRTHYSDCKFAPSAPTLPGSVEGLGPQTQRATAGGAAQGETSAPPDSFANLIDAAEENAELVAQDLRGLTLTLETIRTALGRVDTLSMQLRAARRWMETVGASSEQVSGIGPDADANGMAGGSK